jgi:hypothetical protein
VHVPVYVDEDYNTCKIVNVKGIFIHCESLTYKFKWVAIMKLSCSGRKLSLGTGVVRLTMQKVFDWTDAKSTSSVWPTGSLGQSQTDAKSRSRVTTDTKSRSSCCQFPSMSLLLVVTSSCQWRCRLGGDWGLQSICKAWDESLADRHWHWQTTRTTVIDSDLDSDKSLKARAPLLPGL